MKRTRYLYHTVAVLLCLSIAFLCQVSFALEMEAPGVEYAEPFTVVAHEVFSDDDFIELTAVDFTGYVCIKFDTTSISAKYTEKSFYKGVVDYCRALCATEGYADLDYSLIYFEGHTSLRDSKGSVYVDKVISIDMHKEAVESAAKDGFFSKSIPDISENLWKHPALQ